MCYWFKASKVHSQSHFSTSHVFSFSPVLTVPTQKYANTDPLSLHAELDRSGLRLGSPGWR